MKQKERNFSIYSVEHNNYDQSPPQKMRRLVYLGNGCVTLFEKTQVVLKVGFSTIPAGYRG